MQLRTNIPLKYISLLLFLFELVVPSFLPSPTDASVVPGHKALATITHQAGFSLFLFEESKEERESKEDRSVTYIVDLGFVCFFGKQRVIVCEEINWDLPREHFDTLPPLFALNGAFLV